MSDVTKDLREAGLGGILDFFEGKSPTVTASPALPEAVATSLTTALTPVKLAANTAGATISTITGGASLSSIEGVAVEDAGSLIGAAATAALASKLGPLAEFPDTLINGFIKAGEGWLDGKIGATAPAVA